MGQWVVTVAGIAIMSVLCDVILPDGQTRKYIKTVIGVVVTLVMLQPLISFVSNQADFSYQSNNGADYQVQQSYLDMVQDKQLKLRLSVVNDMLQANGISVQTIEASKEGKIVSLVIKSEYSQEKASIIKEIVAKHFADYELSIAWNNVKSGIKL